MERGEEGKLGDRESRRRAGGEEGGENKANETREEARTRG